MLARRDSLRHMHLHDARGTKSHLALGTADIDVMEYLNLARTCRARIVPEAKTAKRLRRPVDWLKKKSIDFPS